LFFPKRPRLFTPSTLPQKIAHPYTEKIWHKTCYDSSCDNFVPFQKLPSVFSEQIFDNRYICLLIVIFLHVAAFFYHEAHEGTLSSPGKFILWDLRDLLGLIAFWFRLPRIGYRQMKLPAASRRRAEAAMATGRWGVFWRRRIKRIFGKQSCYDNIDGRFFNEKS
jgi:hypothetical protein